MHKTSFTKSYGWIPDRSDQRDIRYGAVYAIPAGLPVVQMSRLFFYYNKRAFANTIDKDSGAMLPDGIKALASQGCCAEAKWPYQIQKFADKPSPGCYADGSGNQIVSYKRIDIVGQMCACLAKGFPFVFGFTVYESFETQAVANTGVAPMPAPKERVLGGQAVLSVGYDDKTKRSLVRNSWRPAWWRKGYFTLPYDYADRRNLSDDFWTIRRGEQM